MINGLEVCTILSCVELISRKQLRDTWIFWLVYATSCLVKTFRGV